MAVVTDKIRSVVDFLVKGFEPSSDEPFEEMNGVEEADLDSIYGVENNLALNPRTQYEETYERPSKSKVVNLPNSNRSSYEVMVVEPRSFDDAANIVQYLKDRKTIVLNLHLLDKEQSQRTIDFVCGAAHALNGKPQKVGDLVFVFTPSNVTLSVEANPVKNKFNDSLWGAPVQQ